MGAMSKNDEGAGQSADDARNNRVMAEFEGVICYCLKNAMTGLRVRIRLGPSTDIRSQGKGVRWFGGSPFRGQY